MGIEENHELHLQRFSPRSTTQGVQLGIIMRTIFQENDLLNYYSNQAAFFTGLWAFTIKFSLYFNFPTVPAALSVMPFIPPTIYSCQQAKSVLKYFTVAPATHKYAAAQHPLQACCRRINFIVMRVMQLNYKGHTHSCSSRTYSFEDLLLVSKYLLIYNECSAHVGKATM